MEVSPFAGQPAASHPLVDIAKLVTAYYTDRLDPAIPEQRVAFGTSGHRGSAFTRTFNDALTPKDITVSHLAGEEILKILTTAPGDGNPIGGVKIIAKSAWFAARPSGTEDVYKVYAESVRGEEHLRRVQRDAQDIISGVFAAARSGKSARR